MASGLVCRTNRANTWLHLHHQRCKREKSPCEHGAIHTWHIASIRTQTLNVRFRGIPDFGWPPNSTPSDTERAALAPLGLYKHLSRKF
jgi:hypothetical protein